jgi:hypothetical protein
VSESVDGGQPEDSGQPRTSNQPGSGGQSRPGNQPASGGQSRPSNQPASGGQSRPSSQPARSGQSRTNGQGGGQARRGNDPIADLQRWLMRAGARSMANQVADQVRRTVGQERRDRGDVWDTATNEPPPEESPECQWCPICQAARAARLSGPGLMSSVADVGGALAAMAQDAFSAFEQVMKDQNRSTERTGAQRPAQAQRPPEPPAPSQRPPEPPAPSPRRPEPPAPTQDPPETPEPTP